MKFGRKKRRNRPYKLMPIFHLAIFQDERQKIEMYKRIRSIDSVEAYEELLDDFIDRFGDFPDEVSALAEVGLIKHYANEIDVVSIKRKDNSVTITIASPSATRLKGYQSSKRLVQ